MRTAVYSRWDGSQEEFRLDGRRALDALSRLLMEGLDAREALEWMRRQGFELAGSFALLSWLRFSANWTHQDAEIDRPQLPDDLLRCGKLL